MRKQEGENEVLTETTSAQPIVLPYPQPNSMLFSQDIDHNTSHVVGIVSFHVL